MPLFICEDCRAIDNTGLYGTFWSRSLSRPLFHPPYAKKALCSECTPVTFIDGTANNNAGKWHGQFPKLIATIDDASVHKGKTLPYELVDAIMQRSTEA